MLLFRKSDDFFGLCSEKVWWYLKKIVTLWANVKKINIMGTDKKYDVFISYRKDDTQERVEFLDSLLKNYYKSNRFPRRLNIFWDKEELSGEWREEILKIIDSETCDKFIIVIGEESLVYDDNARTAQQVQLYNELANGEIEQVLSKLDEFENEDINIDYMRLEIARALKKKTANIVPLVLYKNKEFSIKKLNLPKDIKSLANRHGVSYHNHKINTASFSTIIEQIDEHLFKNKEKPFDNLPQYLLSILRKYWQWTLTILALIVLLLMWVQKHSNIVPNFKSNEKVISIKNNKPVKEVHEYVDLGLSVKWATCNIGASNPIEHGNTFSWGETIEGKNHNWESYKYSRDESSYITKYCDNETIGVVDRKTKLELSDDAANLKWGPNWRIPTKTEFEELMNKCSWKKEKVDEVEGFRVVGKNGNSIFLPFNGFITHEKKLDGHNVLINRKIHVVKNGSGYYWTSSLDVNNPKMAWGFVINPNTQGMNIYERYCGLYIRPVYCGK